MSTDEYMNFNSQKKQKVIDQLFLCAKEAAIDCSLYKKQMKEDYKCWRRGWPYVHCIIRGNKSKEYVHY